METDKLRRASDQDTELQDLFKYYRDHKASYTELSVRGITQGTKAHGLRIGLPKAREFLTLLVECGVGRGVKDESGVISNVVKMNPNTKELGGLAVGDSKNIRRFTAQQKARGLGRALDAVKASPDEVRVFPFRASSNLSITLTINGKPVTMPLPDLEPEELAALIKRLKQAEDKRGT